MIKQKTLKHSIDAYGVGVHTGKKIHAKFRPASPDVGIVFRRVDLNPVVEIPARVSYADPINWLSTSLSKDKVHIGTVEHVLSAFSGLEIDNAYVDVDAAEMPIMDGSANPFVFLLQAAGEAEQQEPKRFIRIIRSIEVREDNKLVRLEPFDGFKISFTIDYDHPIIRNSQQTLSLNFTQDSYVREVARARTFGFLSDYEYIRSRDLAQGASLNNTVVLDDEHVLNPEGLRYADEFVRHKILDAMGDLYLLGHRIKGAFVGCYSGHQLNNQLLAKLLSDKEAWEYVV